jgi:hypothetical protein
MIESKFFFTTYHFNCSQDEFVIYFGWEYFSPMLILYPKSNIVFNISYRYSNIQNFINNSKINYSISHYPINNFISYAIGIIHNSGHYMWQEIYGLMLLFEYNLLDNIDEFLIYKYDYLNIAGILKNKYNKQITFLNSNIPNHNCLINLSKHYISNSLNETFKNIYELKSININNEINILIDIRTNDRIWLNQNTIIVNLINTIKTKYINYNVNFYISGFYTYNKHTINNAYNSNKEINKQNIIFNQIQKSINFTIYNLINSKLSDIVKLCQKMDICIANSGSGISFYNQVIFNKPSIFFTLKSKIIDFGLQRFAFENNLDNGKYLEKKYIIDTNDNNFYLKYGILTPLVISLINKLILPLKL